MCPHVSHICLRAQAKRREGESSREVPFSRWREEQPHPCSSMEDHSECKDFTSLHYWLIPAVLLTMAACFFHKPQAGGAVEHRPCLSERFSFPLPLQMLSVHGSRWGFAVAFGSVVSVLLDRIMRQEVGRCLPFQVPGWATAMVQSLSALEVAVVLYPTFICLTQESSVLGNLMGFGYTLAWFVYQVVRTSENQTKQLPWYSHPHVIPFPSLLCTAYLVLHFLLLFFKVQPMRQHRQPPDEDKRPVVPDHNIQHVKRLLQARVPMSS
ncbi:hypothetical protein MATL_G00145740 [Megalops atlanticus]|uniref:Uncharacterized protein n=1 Tax=Megalops atlanticus TaxID=7932 RepID=A0A9D3PYV4_MEGAT|nr:hypothetical protein MATL_G00145740 [Megalops atlanticus]